MTRHKQHKSQKRAKIKQKEVRAHRDSYRVRHPDESLAHPKPLSKDGILALRKPVPSKLRTPSSGQEAAEEAIPVSAGEKGE